MAHGAGKPLAISTLLLLAAVGVRGAGDYFPEGVTLPTVDRNLPGNLDPAEARWTQAALPEHNARFLPANASYARWISCPWAQFSLGFISHSTPVSSIGARRAPAPSACALRMQTGRRQRRFLVGAGLGLLLGATTDVLRPMPADAGVGAAVSMKDIMDQQEAARRAAKVAEQAKWANRPTELRDNETCLMWNGQKYCTSCVKGCEESKKTFKDIDCIKFCTVEYGAPKPTDEESISFKEFVDGVNKGDVTRVDFFGPNGDKAYATYKVPQGDLGTYIRSVKAFRSRSATNRAPRSKSCACSIKSSFPTSSTCLKVSSTKAWGIPRVSLASRGISSTPGCLSTRHALHSMGLRWVMAHVLLHQ